ncbi:MAG: succinylglutamate desuccinylase/aspartoacylase family protein [Gemmatimonadales bacterium]|nr:succinylglutamate desuccinylase/aspartoacylase family protein [Gemmatimonadales bacterium]
MTRFVRFAVLAALFPLAAPLASGQQSDAFTVGPIRVTAGQKSSGFIDVPAGVDEGTRIPITVIRGTRPGPVVAAIAGTHGYEYPPITALHRLRAALDPQVLRGTVILVHIANLPSFLGRTIYYSPIDGKNLNRVYPGTPDGTVSDRIAYAITTEVIDRADYVIDLHGGDGNEALRPYSYWMLSGDEALDAKSRELVVAFGLDHIVIDRDRPHDPGASVYTSNTALTRGKPGITTETGQLGSNDAHWVDLAERGMWNVLRHLKMVDGEVQRPGPIVWLSDYEVLRSPVTGLFTAAVRDGYAIAEGGLLGVLTDMFGEQVQEVRAPFAGVVNYVVDTPPVSEGEPLAMVSRIGKTP